MAAGANQDFDSKHIKVISIRRPESGSDGSLLLLHSRSYINELEKEVVRLKEVEADTIEARTRAASLLRYKEKADNGVTEIDRKLAFDRRMKRDDALKDAAITLWDYFQSIGVQLDFGSDLSEAEAEYATDDEMSAARRSARIFY